MTDSTFLSVAILVFVMLAIGLGLTIWEFSHGQPSREASKDTADDKTNSQAGPRSPATQRAA